MKSGWDSIWKNYGNLNWFGRRLKRAQTKVLVQIIGRIGLQKNSKVLDVGCGTGSTLHMLRSLGFRNSIGVDFSKYSVEVCSKMFGFRKGKDVFVMDVRKLKFRDRSFDMVFSDGMLEHLPSIEKAVAELCRVSKNYVLLFQPNQESLFAALKSMAPKIKKVSWEKEYPYRISDYESNFRKNGFKLLDSGSINLREMMWLLFVKV
jgi:ubiquinone/menaquinone biosynthesis C-methylase UbiE